MLLFFERMVATMNIISITNKKSNITGNYYE